jgi:hypothetical protein
VSCGPLTTLQKATRRASRAERGRPPPAPPRTRPARPPLSPAGGRPRAPPTAPSTPPGVRRANAARAPSGHRHPQMGARRRAPPRVQAPRATDATPQASAFSPRRESVPAWRKAYLRPFSAKFFLLTEYSTPRTADAHCATFRGHFKMHPTQAIIGSQTMAYGGLVRGPFRTSKENRAGAPKVLSAHTPSAAD